MAALVTLREIVDYLQSLLGPAAAPAPAAAPVPAAAPAPAAAPVAAAPAPAAAPASAAPAPAAAGVDLVGDMLAVVADKTGYPVEMLDLSMALEADLGIDSIKRVEILSAVQDRVPTLPEVDTATMAALVTLREIVDYLQSLLGSPPVHLAHNGASAGDRAPFGS
ncbi:hypothetical protein AWC18_12000 [Mycolicibacter nonchromogenicus]|uniref:Carrier domain-containing protein n=2 Tax=Mycolicibacter nonchromogenicus TaxID=1782 RepID=A0A1X1ZAF8_MYCNO|nr:hypothetical protein AWC18_12000 [Mycolicibacter nonchromogenicus]